MSNNLTAVLANTKKTFLAQNEYNLKWESECLFAKQQLLKNDYTMKAAQNAPQTLESAIYNVAAIGISLNPATAHAYLVPRDGAICLDISYRGLVKLATDSGAVEWAVPELVYEGDTFEYQGISEPPIHKADPFSTDRTWNNLKGAYCVAKLVSGGYLTCTMSKADIEKVRSTSKAANGPWKNWPEEMAKKTVVKRASKSWPQSNGRERMDRAIEVLNEHEGLEVDDSAKSVAYLQASPDQSKAFHALLQGDSSAFAAWFTMLDAEIQTSLYNDFPKGEITKGKQLVQAKQKEGLAALNAMLEIIEGLDPQPITDFAEDLCAYEIAWFEDRASDEGIDALYAARELVLG